MRRSICFSEPAQALAGETRTWKFTYTPSTSLPKGTRLKFDLQSKGREIDWQIPSAQLKKGKGIIFAQLSNGKILQATEVETEDSFVPSYEFLLPAALSAGDPFTIILGNKEEDKKGGGGIQAQTTAQRRRTFALYVDPSGRRQYPVDPEVFMIDVRGNVLTNIRILTPSFVAKNKRFEAMVRFEDEFGNLTGQADENTLIELTHEHLRENLSWRLFVPETGFMTLPNLYFNEPGIYTLQLKNLITKKVFRSFPIKCFAECSKHLYWGALHGESERFDSTENIENCLRHFRDDRACQFWGSSPFEGQEETSNETWKHISQHVDEFDEADRFVTFLGCQWHGESPEEGLRQFIFPKDNKSLLRKKDLKNSTLKKLYKSLTPKELIAIPEFTMGEQTLYNFDHFEPAFERVAEIYNAWGCSEMSQKEGNSRPITFDGSQGIREKREGSIRQALNRNRRFGFVAGGLDDRGIFAALYDSDQVQYTPGLTAIIAPAHTREALFEALYQRSCYATTGPRIIVGLYLAGTPMGREMSTADKPGLMVNRHLSGYVAGTTKLRSVELIRNGEVIHSCHSPHYYLDFAYDDLTPFDKVCLKGPDAKKSLFSYYYLRVTQEDGHMAWSSPIWVDYVEVTAATRSQSKRAAPPPKEKLPVEESFFDEDSDEDTYEED